MSGNLVYLPAAIGELYDKITILEIKAERIVDPGLRSKVLEELALLLAIRHDGCARDDASLKKLVDSLRQVNGRIWDTEDAVRAFARRGDFGADYIVAARGSYTNNDERARLKHEINVLTQSSIVEVKFHGNPRR